MDTGFSSQYANYIRVCFEGDWPGGFSGRPAQTSYTAMQQWNNKSAEFRVGRILYEGPTGPSDCGFLRYPGQLKLRWVSIGTTGPLMRWGNPGYADNGLEYSSEIQFNSARSGEIWWYGADQNCYPPNCLSDAWTMAAHELGHSLMLAHRPQDGDRAHCVGGYYSTNTASACSGPYGKDVMYANAGDGYRRWLSSDDIGGVRYWYGNL